MEFVITVQTDGGMLLQESCTRMFDGRRGSTFSYDADYLTRATLLRWNPRALVEGRVSPKVPSVLRCSKDCMPDRWGASSSSGTPTRQEEDRRTMRTLFESGLSQACPTYQAGRDTRVARWSGACPA